MLAWHSAPINVSAMAFGRLLLWHEGGTDAPLRRLLVQTHSPLAPFACLRCDVEDIEIVPSVTGVAAFSADAFATSDACPLYKPLLAVKFLN
jgi:hypothetical protein